MSNSADIEDNTQVWLKVFNKAIVNFLEESGLRCETYAKQNLTKNGSVDTGRLRNSVMHRLEAKNTEVIGSAVEYSLIVETKRFSRKGNIPYLRPALNDNQDTYRAIFHKHFGS